MNQTWGQWGQEPTAAELEAIQFAPAQAGTGTEIITGAAGAGVGTLANPILGLVTAVVGGVADVWTGVTGLKTAKQQAAAAEELARAQLMTSAIQYRQAALDAQLAPALQAQQLAAARERNMLVLIFGFGALMLAVVGLRVWSRPEKRRSRAKGKKR